MRTDAVFSALASPVRRRILELLLNRPRSAGEIASEFHLNRPAVSEHVHLLSSLGLVSRESSGRRRIYRLNAAALSAATEWLRPFERYWRARMRALEKTLDEEELS